MCPEEQSLEKFNCFIRGLAQTFFYRAQDFLFVTSRERKRERDREREREKLVVATELEPMSKF